MVQAYADSLGLPWEGELRRLDALRLLFACRTPDTTGCQAYTWRFEDWQELDPPDQVTVGTALARGWLADMPWELARAQGRNSCTDWLLQVHGARRGAHQWDEARTCVPITGNALKPPSGL